MQDNGTRLRTDNSTIHNQVIGGDGLGTNYSIDNTNTVIGSAQGSSMRTNLSNTPPVVFQNWAAATSGLSDSAGFGFFTAIIPRLPASIRRAVCSSISRVRASGAPQRRTDLDSDCLGDRARPRPDCRDTAVPLQLIRSWREPADLNRIAIGAAGGFVRRYDRTAAQPGQIST
jgi:hypothetical protein